jgi:DNA helicase HerA-like ATPase
VSEGQVSLGHLFEIRGIQARARFGAEALEGGDADGGVEKSQARIGDLVKMRTPESTVFGIVGGLSLAGGGGAPEGTLDIDLIGEVIAKADGDRLVFQRGISYFPALGSAVLGAEAADQRIVYAAPDKASVKVGQVHQASEVAAHLVVDDLLNKHFAILGTTGSGKSCAAALVLRAILDAHPNGHVILLDPHDEYEPAFGALAEKVTIDNLHLPYWLLNFDELVEVLVSKNADTRDSEMRILKDALFKARKSHAENAELAYVTVDTPVPYRSSALKKLIDDEMGKLDKPEGSAPFLRLLSKLESMTGDRRFGFMFSSLMVRDILADILARLLRVPVAGKPITIIDLSGVPAEVTDVVVSVLCRIVFDFALWNADKQAVPVLLVCEEAHRYIPERESSGFAPTKRAIGQIAKEGRKYGVSLCLVTQRPSELSAGILSQCGTLVALRMSNEQDLAYVRGALPEGSAGLLAVLPALRTQEAVVVGEGVTVPMRVRLDTLESSRRPRSGSVPYSAAWQAEKVDAATIAATVARWRQQSRK